jgi:hypothetical protein
MVLWSPIWQLPWELQHLGQDETAAQRYMGYTAISILRCAALDQFRRTYWAPDRGSRLRKLKNLDDKELFKVIESQFLVFFPVRTE